MRLPALSPYDIDSLTFAREERIGNTALFVGRAEELNSLIQWAIQIPKRLSKSNALLARRKKGKTAILERLYNYIYTLNTNLVPFYFEVKEDDVWINHFSEDFYRGFVSQYLGFKLKDISLIRKPPEFAKLKELSRQNQLTVLEEDITAFENLSKRKDAGPLMWHHAAAAPQATRTSATRRLCPAVRSSLPASASAGPRPSKSSSGRAKAQVSRRRMTSTDITASRQITTPAAKKKTGGR